MQAQPTGPMTYFVDATAGTAHALIRSQADYFSKTLARGATPATMVTDSVQWLATMTRRQRPRWWTAHRIVEEWPLARLRDFSLPTDSPVRPTLLLPPQAGHDSCIVDFAPGQSQIRVAQEAGLSRLWSLDWKGATRETRDEGIESYIALLDDVLDRIGEPANLIGDCQGGWLAAIYAALRPKRVNSLTIAGAPIDFHAGNAAIRDWVRALAPDPGMAFYRNAVALNNGVLPGSFLLAGFLALQPANEMRRHAQLLANLHDRDHVDRYRKFEDWFKHTQPIPGRFYLWIVRHLFRDNELIRGKLVVGGERVDLSRIDCPLFLIAGDSDHITPAEQVFALGDAASTSPGHIAMRTVNAGHLGLFMGHESLNEHWAPVLEQIRQISTRPATPITPPSARPRT